MTIYLPLDDSLPLPPTPSFLVPASDTRAQLARVTKAIRKARRIAVVCGAGISVQAGIPDFRSSDGLFQTLKKDNPKEAMTSGKDLFDASVFNSETMTSIFCQMMGQLSELSQVAEPTPFHHLLRALDSRGKLLRVYTQNIDALEAKCGLSFGVPDFDDRRNSYRPKVKPPAEPYETLAQTRLPSPPLDIPRCVPLHGTLQRLHCLNCNHSFPAERHVAALSAGVLPPCPECTALEATRQLVGKRSRGIGRLRPDVVLYNEPHKDGEGVGEVVRRDLVGRRGGADLLVVVGTSLRVPGTKRIVREFSKAVRARGAPAADAAENVPAAGPSRAQTQTQTPPRGSPAAAAGEEAPVRTIYLNLDFPVPTREWEGVFDVWVHGDAQQFAQTLHAELLREERAKAGALERKRARAAQAAEAGRRRALAERAQARGMALAQGEKGKGGKAGVKRKAPPTAPAAAGAKSAKRRTAAPPAPARQRAAARTPPSKAPAASTPTSASTSAAAARPPPAALALAPAPPSARTGLFLRIPARACPAAPGASSARSPRTGLTPAVVIPTSFVRRAVHVAALPTPAPSPRALPPSSGASERSGPGPGPGSGSGSWSGSGPGPMDVDVDVDVDGDVDGEDSESELSDDSQDGVTRIPPASLVRTLQYGLRAG